ncbi:helix-turn-helix transcriptional regulator [Carnobacteriaceae bacterium zg-ZUI240]|nr:helix-turn-helix transcriptional regulator [Carnobacteriaceae bacterium zg-ZUI240]
MKLGEKIRLLRKENKYTMQDLADKANLTKGYISMLENGKNPGTNKEIIPSLETVQNIALAFNIDLEELLTDVYSTVELPKKKLSPTLSSTVQSIVDTSVQLESQRQHNVLNYANTQLDEQNSRKLSLDLKEDSEDYIFTKVAVTEAVAAGRGFAYGDNEVMYCYTDKELPHYDIASYITGDSMEPEYHDGDVVLIKREMYSSPDVYVVDYDGKSYLKKVYQEKDHFRLVSFNEAYEDIIIDLPIADDIYVNIVGRVVGSFTPVKG